MPCHVDPPSPQELRLADEYFTKSVALFDDLTHRNDVIREWLLNPTVETGKSVLKAVKGDLKSKFKELERLANQSTYASPNHKYYEKAQSAHAEFLWLTSLDVSALAGDEREHIENVQTEHRKADLKRLAATFVEKWDMESLKKVIDADPTKPLEPQLGFDPDAF